eukprot:1155413-Pelagomonas_calceolata.AAC.3
MSHHLGFGKNKSHPQNELEKNRKGLCHLKTTLCENHAAKGCATYEEDLKSSSKTTQEVARAAEDNMFFIL